MTSRRIAAIALVTLLAAAGCSPSGDHADGAVSAGPGVAFVKAPFDEALAKARSENRILLVDVYTDWCGWCKKLDREVFADARVARAAGPLIAVKVDAEKEGEGVARRYDVQGFPTILFVDGSGKVVRRVEGYVDASEMLRILSGLPKKG